MDENPNEYPKGASLRISATFKDAAGALADPGDVIVQVRNSAGTVSYEFTNAEVIRDSLGVFHKDLSLSVDGWWYYSISGTSPVEAARHWLFYVKPPYV